MADHESVPASSLRLLRQIADHDSVLFTVMPRGRWQNPHTGDTFNDRTFYPLDRLALIDVGDSRTDPVRVTPAGRSYLAIEEADRG